MKLATPIAAHCHSELTHIVILKWSGLLISSTHPLNLNGSLGLTWRIASLWYSAMDFLQGRFRLGCASIPIHFQITFQTTFVDAHDIGKELAPRVLLQLHRDLVAARQLGDRVCSAAINHTCVGAITDHPVAAVVRPQMNLARPSIDADDLGKDLLLIQLQSRSPH